MFVAQIPNLYSDYYDDFFEQGLRAAQQTAENWNDHWHAVLSGTVPGGTALYGALADVGEYFAVGTLLVLMILIFRDLNEGKPYSLENLIWPLIVATLLANNGNLLAQTTIGLRSIINNANQTVLETTLAGVNLNQIYRQANGLANVQQEISALVQECASSSNEELSKCLAVAQEAANDLIDKYKQKNGSNLWIENLQADLADTFADGILGGTVNLVFSSLLSNWQPILYSVLSLMQIAYQNLLEATLLLTALLGPVAVGGSLLPMGVRPVFAWLTGFFSVGMAKLSFNIIVGLTAAIATNNSVGDPGWFPLFCAILAPLLSFGLAAGGGLAVWNGITIAAGTTVAVAAKKALI